MAETERPGKSGKIEKEKDLRYVSELLALLDDRGRHEVLQGLSIQVLNEAVKTSERSGRGQTILSLDLETEPGSAGYVNELLTAIRPRHDAYGYLGDYWHEVWDGAWPDGLADVVLGSACFYSGSADALLREVWHQAEELCIPADPPYDAEDFTDFINEWRERFLATVRALMSGE